LRPLADVPLGDSPGRAASPASSRARNSSSAASFATAARRCSSATSSRTHLGLDRQPRRAGRVKPTSQFGIESRLPAFFELAGLPGETTEAGTPAEWLPRLASRQHPDRD